MTDPRPSELGEAIQEVTEKVQLLVREEIALAKAELTEKVSKLIRGIVAGAVAGIFALFGLIYLLHAASWGIWEILGTGNGPWLGFLIVTLILFLLGAIGGLLAFRMIKKAMPPTPVDGHRGGAADPRDRLGLAARAPRHLRPGGPVLMGAARSPEEIRRSIEANRAELGMAVEKLRSEVAVVTDWRGQLRANQKNVLIGAAVAGFVLGGGIAAVGGLFRRRR